MKVTFVCDKAFESQSRGIMKQATVPVRVEVISAGKLRRYSHMPMYKQIFHKDIGIKNIVDTLKISKGFYQSLRLIKKYQPDAVFIKGGYVCLPMGLAAAMKKIPIIIHDSDVRPGLTNKVLSRFATRIATGAPLENYSYNKEISEYTGVPIDSKFQPISPVLQREYKKKLGFDADNLLVVATGGGLGARTINQAMVSASKRLVDAGISVFHISGKLQYEEWSQKIDSSLGEYKMVPFVFEGMEKVLGAADIIVARGSATFLQEMAGMAKSVIIIPAQQLGDQLKNAEVFAKSNAAKTLTDTEITQSNALEKEIISLAGDEKRRHLYSVNLHKFAKPNAAKDVAKMIKQSIK